MKGIIRKIARINIEAATPLLIGSGKHSQLIDALILKDVNDLPMIQGTSILGVIRHIAAEFFTNQEIKLLFGTTASEEAEGALIRVSQARFVSEKSEVSESINGNLRKFAKSFFSVAPVRQHVRITDKGVAQDKGLYDHEVVLKGAQFVFEIELLSRRDDEGLIDADFEKIVKILNHPSFLLGGGSRKGFGGVKMLEILVSSFDLRNEEDRNAYFNYPKSLTQKPTNAVIETCEPFSSHELTNYTLRLEADKVSFIFGDNAIDEWADSKSKEEMVLQYRDGKISQEAYFVIPGSSVKGAIAHRYKFHLNKLLGIFADAENVDDVKKQSLETAFRDLLGDEGMNYYNEGTKQGAEKMAGSLFIKDVFLPKHDIANEKIFTHVAIDRFTGGAMEGALFDEKALFAKGEISININVKSSCLQNELIKQALENTLIDIASGYLPLGGMVTKGHGIFTGTLFCNEELKFNHQPI